MEEEMEREGGGKGRKMIREEREGKKKEEKEKVEGNKERE